MGARGVTLFAGGLLVALAVAGCQSAAPSASAPSDSVPSDSPPSDPESARTVLTVSAAASLTDVMDALLEAYRDVEPGVEIVPNHGSSAQLVQQVIAGASVDVLLAADETAVRPLIEAGLAEEATLVASNELTLVVPSGNPAGIHRLSDLAGADARVSLCAPSVPCGRSAAAVLDAADVRLLAPSEENDVRAVLSKVAVGEADAGFVYRTDVRAAGNAVDEVPIDATGSNQQGSNQPGANQPGQKRQGANQYPVLVLTDSSSPDEARAFRDWLLSPPAQALFAAAGFGPPA